MCVSLSWIKPMATKCHGLRTVSSVGNECNSAVRVQAKKSPHKAVVPPPPRQLWPKVRHQQYRWTIHLKMRHDLTELGYTRLTAQRRLTEPWPTMIGYRPA